MSTALSRGARIVSSPRLIRSLICTGFSGRALARISRTPVPQEDRRDTFLLLSPDAQVARPEDMAGYAAVLLESGRTPSADWPTTLPSVEGLPALAGLAPDTVAAVDPQARTLQLLYRPDSVHNALFVTNRCNSHCVMCPQPPTAANDNWLLAESLRILALIRSAPEVMGITGGEPTLLGPGFIQLLDALGTRFPETCVYVLTNGRLFAYWDYAAAVAAIGHRNLTVEIPLYADTADLHDEIVDAPGAFDQTLAGLYNLARLGQSIRLRVVLGRETIPRLVALMEYVYRNLPFLSEVALMGMEPMGYVKKNWARVWIDPVDYASTLEAAVRHGALRGIPVSVFNVPLCVLPRGLWPFARQSISDHKNVFLPTCEECAVRPSCSGLFASELNRHSRGIRPIAAYCDSPKGGPP